MTWRACVLATLLLGFDGTALAQSDASQERARQLYDEGVEHYEHHEYELAVDAFKSAFALSGKPNLLFNIAVAYEEWNGSNHCEDARGFFRRYLDARPDAPDGSNVETRLSRLDQICPAAAPPATVAPLPPPPLPPPPKLAHKTNVASLVIALSGLVVAGAGAGTLGATAFEYGELKNRCPCPPSTWQGWQAAEYLSYVLLAAGGVMLASGLVWFGVHPSTSAASVVVGARF